MKSKQILTAFLGLVHVFCFHVLCSGAEKTQDPPCTSKIEYFEVAPCGSVIIIGHNLNVPSQKQGQWEYTGQMDSVRTNHLVIPYDDGRLLIIGGNSLDPEADPETNSSTTPRQGEIYNPATATWEPGPLLNTGRTYYAGILLNNGGAALIGGGNLSGRTPNIEFFHPDTESFSESTDMHFERIGHDAVELDDGRILVAGGTDGWGTFFNSSEIYHPETDSWEMIQEPFVVPRSLGKLIKLDDGKVLYIGGSTWEGSHNEVDIFNPSSNQWNSLPPMNKQRQQFNITRMEDGRIMVIGGLNQATETYSCTEIYDPAENTWSMGPSMNNSRSDASLISLPDGDLLIAGGQNRKCTERFNQENNSWEEIPEMNDFRYWFGMSLLPSGEILATGGSYGWEIIRQTAEILPYYFGATGVNSDILDFGDLSPGEQSAYELLLINKSFAWTKIYDYAFSEQEFSFSQALPLFLFPQKDTTLTVTFSGRETPGSFQETLTLFIDNGDGPETLELILKGNITQPTAIPDDISQDMDVLIYPIPATSHLNIQSNKEILQIRLFDLSGQEIIRHEMINDFAFKINTEQLNNGIYILSIKTPFTILSKKVFITG